MARRIWFGLACVTVAAASATACFVRESDEAETAPQQVTEGRESALSAVVALEGGCTAVKVGPKHLLVAARCVTNRPSYAIGKPLRFRAANPMVVAGAPKPADDGGDGGDAAVSAPDAKDGAASTERAEDAAADASEAGAVAAASDAGDGGDAGMTGAYETTIAQVQIHPSFLAKCGTGACAVGKTGAVEVADVAVIIVSRDIADLATAPIDLDPVSIGDSMLALGYGCDATADAAPQLRARATAAVSADAVNHTGSPYDARPDLAREMAKSYVVTRGPGNVASAGAPGICSAGDLGAPIFRSDGSSVVGVSSATTLAANGLPTTNQHARVDAASRHQVGAWLAQLGVKTTRTCSAADAGGCPKQPESSSDSDGGDASAPSTEPTLPDLEPGTGNEAPDEGSSTKDRSTDGTEDEPKTKKKSTESSGCSAAPITPSSTSASTGFGFLAAAALALTLRSRRRR